MSDLTLGSAGQRRAKNRFVGRRTETEKFRESLEKTLKLGRQIEIQDILYPHIFLIVGLGGMGKTWLTREFISIAELQKVSTIYLDAEHYRVADEDGLMRTLHDEVINKLGDKAEKALNVYREAVTERERVRRKVEDARTEYDTLVGAGAKLLTGAVPSAFATIAEEGIKRTIHGGAKALAEAEDKFMDWLRKRRKLDDEEYRLATNPYAITEKIMSGLSIAAGDNPLVIALDTYELLDRHDAWMRTALKYSGPRLLWIIAGREDDDFLRRYRDVFDEEFLAQMRINVFARGDIMDYLRNQNFLPNDADSQEALIDTIQNVSQGVPLAVEALVNLRQQDVNIAELFADVQDKRLARKEVVETLATRFLKWCDAEQTTDEAEKVRRQSDKRWIEGLALLGRYDRSALLWLGQKMQPDDPPNPDALLDGLHDRYSFIFGNEENEMHDLVREVLREHLQQEKPTLWLEQFANVAVEYYTQEMQKIETEIGDDRSQIVGDEVWQEAAFALLNAKYWADRHGRAGTQMFVPLAVETHFFAYDFLAECLSLVDEFTTVDAIHRETYKRWQYGNEATAVGYPASEEAVALWDNLRLQSDSYNFSPIQKAIIWLKSAEILHSKEKYVEMIQTYQWIGNFFKPLPISMTRRLSDGLEQAIAELIYLRNDLDLRLLAVSAAKLNVELNPNDLTTWGMFGVALRYTKQYDEAIPIYQKAISLDPTNANLYDGLATVYRILEKYEDAQLILEQAAKLPSATIITFVSLVGVYRKLHRNEKIEDYLRRARELIPEDDYYNRACLESIVGNIDAALDYLEKELRGGDIFREFARQDPDFEFIRDDPRFKKLVGLE